MAVSAHPVVFSHLLPSHTWHATCLNCGEKCESESQVPLCFSVTERRSKFIYKQLVRHSGYCMYQPMQTLAHFASTTKKTHHVFITKAKRKISKEAVTECYMSCGLNQCFPNIFVRGPLLAYKNNHGSPHTCSRKYSVRVVRIQN